MQNKKKASKVQTLSISNIESTLQKWSWSIQKKNNCKYSVELDKIKPYHGDGYCDDAFNDLNCDFDKGDCCGGKLDNCKKCECLSDKKCKPEILGDGICQDSANR